MVTKALHLDKPIVWYYIKKKNSLVCRAMPKKQEDHGKQVWWMTEDSPGVDVSLSTLTIK